MKQTKHTPGPWEQYAGSIRTVEKCEQYGEGYRAEMRQRPIAEVAHLRGQSEVNAANAERIVACVNACEGIADPSAVPELLAHLEKCANVISHCLSELPEGYRKAAKSQGDAARAAIAKATGGTI